MNKQSKFKIWLDCCRPKTLTASIAPVLIGAAMASDTGSFDKVVMALTFAAALLIQIGTNLANDYYDFIKGADTETRVGPTRATQAALNADCDGQAGLQQLAGCATMLFYQTKEAQEGRNAFVEKRKPDFSGF